MAMRQVYDDIFNWVNELEPKELPIHAEDEFDESISGEVASGKESAFSKQ